MEEEIDTSTKKKENNENSNNNNTNKNEEKKVNDNDNNEKNTTTNTNTNTNNNNSESNNNNNNESEKKDIDEEAPLKYIFHTVDDPSHYGNIFTKDNFKTLEKWGLSQNMELVKFRFNTSFQLKDLDRFLKDLFNDPTIKKNFPPISHIIPQKENQNLIENFKYKVLNTKAVTMDIFDVMYERNIVSAETGYIHQDYDQYVEDITVSDKLKQALLIEDSESYSIFEEENRDEFLFHIFKRIVIGGSLCQYENNIQPYLDMTKCFYKDIVSAAKDPDSGKIYIRSVPIEILDVEKNNIYKIKNHPQNFFYVIIDPYQRYVHLWYHKWVPFW
jgi:hypothetical protein